MTKFILILSFILQAVLAYSQYKVIDQDSKLPIPYAYIKNTAKNSSLITNFNGEFSIASTYNNIDSLRITCIGFKDKFVTVATLKQNHVIELAPLAKQLDEVIVSAKKDKYQTKKLGVTRKPKTMFVDHSITGRNGNELATWIPNKYSIPGRLKAVNIFITNDGFPDAYFRVHIYECDLLQTKPGKELTKSNIIASGTKGNEWVNINLENERIYIPENGCFVGIEWFDCPRSLNYRDTIKSEGVAYKHGKPYDTVYLHIRAGNGVVLGSIDEIYKYSKNKNWFRTTSLEKWTSLSELTSESKFYIPDTLKGGLIYKRTEYNVHQRVPCINIDVSFKKDKIKPAYNSPPRYKLNRIERIKENPFKYPQANVTELFASLIKAFESDEIVYALKYLCVYKDDDLKEILNDLIDNKENTGELITQQERAEITAHLNEVYNHLPQGQLIKVAPTQFELKLNNFTHHLTVENGLWKISPYVDRILKYRK